MEFLPGDHGEDPLTFHEMWDLDMEPLAPALDNCNANGLKVKPLDVIDHEVLSRISKEHQHALSTSRSQKHYWSLNSSSGFSKGAGNQSVKQMSPRDHSKFDTTSQKKSPKKKDIKIPPDQVQDIDDPQFVALPFEKPVVSETEKFLRDKKER